MNTSERLEQYRNGLRAPSRRQLNRRSRARQIRSDVVQMTELQIRRDQRNFIGQDEVEHRASLKTFQAHDPIKAAKTRSAGMRDIQIVGSIDQQLQESAILSVGELPADPTSPREHVMRQDRAEQLADALSRLPQDDGRPWC